MFLGRGDAFSRNSRGGKKNTEKSAKIGQKRAILSYFSNIETCRGRRAPQVWLLIMWDLYKFLRSYRDFPGGTVQKMSDILEPCNSGINSEGVAVNSKMGTAYI